MNPDALKSLEVFSTLDDAVLAELSRVVEERTYADGQTVFVEGDPGEILFCVVEGVVRIEKRIDAGSQATKTLSILTPGDFFGEMSVIDRKPRSASAVANGATRLLALPRSAFQELLAHSQHSAVRLLFSLMRAMNERIRRLNASVVAYDEIGRGIGSSEQLQPLLELVLRQLVTALGAEQGVLFLQAQFHEEFEARCTHGLSSDPIPAERMIAPGVVSRVAAERVGWVITDRSRDPRCVGMELRSWESPAMVLAPLSVGSGVLGILVLGHSRVGRFDVNHLNLAEGIARQTAQAVLNLRHREEQQARTRLGRQFVKF